MASCLRLGKIYPFAITAEKGWPVAHTRVQWAPLRHFRTRRAGEKNMRTVRPFSWKVFAIQIAVTIIGVTLMIFVLWLAKGRPPLW